MFLIGSAFINLIGAIGKSPFLIQISSIVTLLVGTLGFLSWLIAGNIIRWRKEGLICSGNFRPFLSPPPHGILVKSGNFIQIWNILVFSLMAFGLCVIVGYKLLYKNKQ